MQAVTTNQTNKEELNIENAHAYIKHRLISAYGLSNDIERAEDLASDIVLTLLENNTYDASKASFKTFVNWRIKTYVTNHYALKKVVKAVNASKLELNNDNEQSSFSLGITAETAETDRVNKELLKAVLSRFDAKTKRYIGLLLNGHKNTEIATILGFSSYGTFRVWRTRTLEKYNLSELLASMANYKNKPTYETVYESYEQSEKLYYSNMAAETTKVYKR